MFYNFEERKKKDFITSKRLRENICPQRLLLLSEGNHLCLYYRLAKENRSSCFRTNIDPRRNFLLFLKGNIITFKTFSLWTAPRSNKSILFFSHTFKIIGIGPPSFHSTFVNFGCTGEFFNISSKVFSFTGVFFPTWMKKSSASSELAKRSDVNMLAFKFGEKAKPTKILLNKVFFNFFYII